MVCAVDLLESTAIATTLAIKNGYKLNYSQARTAAAWVATWLACP